ncbi:MAG TPA: c-type cytochrome, partial [Gammaproteobacteria bacterium]
HISEEDSLEAAEFFAGLPPRKWLNVVETDTVPRTYTGDGRMHFVHPDGSTVPLGNRIVETPVEPALATARHPYAQFTTFVPVGSVARGEMLATTGGNGTTVQCSICHGEGLRGLGDIPRIAGVSAVYTVRQLNDFRSGMRNGPSAALMHATVVNLTDEDIVALAAYLASLDP